MASVNRSADAARNTLRGIIERNGTPTVRLLDALAAVMVMVVVALGLIKFLLRRAYAKRVLAFAAMGRSQQPPDYVPLLDLSVGDRGNQVEADPDVAPGLKSVKQAVDEIKEAVAEMASSRQLRTPL
jgi:hypothetical protein